MVVKRWVALGKSENGFLNPKSDVTFLYCAAYPKIDSNLGDKKNRRIHSGPVYTGTDKFLHRRILFLDCLMDQCKFYCRGVYTDPCKA